MTCHNGSCTWLYRVLVCAFCVFAGSAGCSSSETRLTQVLVAVDADDNVARNLSRVQVETYSTQGSLVGSLSYAIKSDETGPGIVQFPFSVGVVKRTSDDFLVVVTGYAGDEPVIERKALATFVAGEVRALGVYLESPCFGQLCGERDDDAWLARTCVADAARGARCESVAVQETVSVAAGTELDPAVVHGADAGAGATCDGGSCTDECSAGEQRCADARRLERCEAGRWTLETECSDPSPVCVQSQCRVCEPEAVQCLGTVRQVCDAEGSAWAKESVSMDVCGAKCVPGVKRCFGEFVQRCDASGDWSDPSIIVGECGVLCNAGEESCAGTQPRTCNEDGTAWIEHPVAQGRCGAECNPGASECQEARSRSCSALGQWSEYTFAPPSCGAVCVPGNVRCTGTTPQGCSTDGRAWADQAPQAGTCDCSKPAPPGFGENCGSCGGKVQCDGTCSIPTPLNLNQDCGSCGGKVQCGGTCSVPTPMNFNQDCGSCGGKVRCDGTCSVSTPNTFANECGSCGGKVQCDGTCSVPTPPNINEDCGSCGGKVRCDGTCSVSTPADINQPCGRCNGSRQCDGTCSVGSGGLSCPRGCCNHDFECGWCVQCNPPTGQICQIW
ncbi:MAG TPA: hypothetical protein VFZ61_34565 [Polyangiales bacterium]